MHKKSRSARLGSLHRYLVSLHRYPVSLQRQLGIRTGNLVAVHGDAGFPSGAAAA
jgi:hypothetical protein